jgi:hypothetical protein
VIDVDEFFFLGDPAHPTSAATMDAQAVADLDGLDAIV